MGDISVQDGAPPSDERVTEWTKVSFGGCNVWLSIVPESLVLKSKESGLSEYHHNDEFSGSSALWRLVNRVFTFYSHIFNLLINVKKRNP